MMRVVLAFLVLTLAACSGRAWDTTVAEQPHVRAAMVDSVIIGTTTERAFIGRWGRPVQVLREGAQVSYIYRNLGGPKGGQLLRYGTSGRFVIVDFQYGIATGIRTSDQVGCRSTFPPWPSDYVVDNPSTVHPLNCDGAVIATVAPPVATAPAVAVPRIVDK